MGHLWTRRCRPVERVTFEAGGQRSSLRVCLACVQSGHRHLCRARRENNHSRDGFEGSWQRPMNSLLSTSGRLLARYLAQPIRGYEPVATHDPALLRGTLRPCDVLLIEGNTRISTAIKYLTQSTWSHAALYIGDAVPGFRNDPDPPVLVEADLVQGVCAVPLSRYHHFHTRICRPVELSEADRRHIVEAAVARIGHTYDLKNVIDLV